MLALGRLPGLRIDRTGAAVVGAILMVTIGGLGFEQATRAVDYRTLVLLFGMMVLVAHLQMATFFRSTARLIAAHVAGPRALVTAITVASGVLSAFFVNDTVCLMFTPIVLEVALLRHPAVAAAARRRDRVEHRQRRPPTSSCSRAPAGVA